jgi:WD40 repeat protein
VSTGEVRIWNVATGALVSRLPDVRGLWTVDFSRDGRRLLTGHAYDRAVDEGWRFQVWEVATGRRLGQVPSSLAFVPAQWSDDGRKLVVAARSKIVRVWDVDSGLPLTSPMKHQGALTSVEFSPDGSRVLTSSADSTARLWDATTGLALAEPMSHAGPVTSARFSADGQWVATTAGHEARVWETAPGFGPAPAWLAALAEAIGGLRFDDRGVIEPVSADELSGLRNALADAPAADAYARWAAWFFADRGTRNISVQSSLALPEYVRRRVEIGGPKALEEALRLCPTNASALARLTPLRQERNMAIHGLGTGQKFDGRRSEIWRRRAELLAQRGSLAEALDTLEEGARSPRYRLPRPQGRDLRPWLLLAPLPALLPEPPEVQLRLLGTQVRTQPRTRRPQTSRS